MKRFDIAIIGTGPAGLEAAITAKIRGKDILLLGNSYLSDKVFKAQSIDNYLGFSNISGGDMQRMFLEHLDRLDISITEDRVNAVYAMGSYFAIQGHTKNYEASAVILATGVSAVKTYPGEIENLGRGVSYCATCDAALYRGKTAAVIAFSEKEEAEAEFLAEIAEQVYYFKMYENECGIKGDNINVISDKVPEAIKRTGQGVCVIAGDKEFMVDGVFVLRENVMPTQLVPGLEMTDNHVKVGRSMETNISGCFACGDVTGTPYQYIKAAGEGNVAALSAVDYLRKLQKEK